MKGASKRGLLKKKFSKRGVPKGFSSKCIIRVDDSKMPVTKPALPSGKTSPPASGGKSLKRSSLMFTKRAKLSPTLEVGPTAPTGTCSQEQVQLHVRTSAKHIGTLQPQDKSNACFWQPGQQIL